MGRRLSPGTQNNAMHYLNAPEELLENARIIPSGGEQGAPESLEQKFLLN